MAGLVACLLALWLPACSLPCRFIGNACLVLLPACLVCACVRLRSLALYGLSWLAPACPGPALCRDSVESRSIGCCLRSRLALDSCELSTLSTLAAFPCSILIV